MVIRNDERHVLGRPHPVDRIVKHGRQTAGHGYEATFGTARRAGGVAKKVGKILFYGTLASAATGFGLSEAHNLLHIDAGITEEPWPVLVGIGGEVATIGGAAVVGLLGAAEVKTHHYKHRAEFTAKAGETGAVGVEAIIDGLFHLARHGARKARARYAQRQRPH